MAINLGTAQESSSGLILRGLVSVVFGLIILLWPGMSLVALTFAFGLYALADGVLAIATMAAHQTSMDRIVRPALLLEGIAGIGFGVLTLVWPQITVLMLLYFVAAWAFVTGVLEITAAVQLRKEIDYEWLLGLGGVLAIVLSGLLIAYPERGVVSLLLFIGAYTFAFGVLLVILAWRRRSLDSTAATAGYKDTASDQPKA